MSKIRIITDSCCDLSKEITEELGITVIPLEITFNGETFYENDKTADEFYDMMSKNDEIPKHAAINPSRFEDAYKQAYINATEADITLTKSPVGMPGRAILNPFLKRAKEGQIPHGRCHLCVSTCKPMETPYCITDALVNAAQGRVDDALLFCGTNAYRAKGLEHVHDIMQEFA